MFTVSIDCRGRTEAFLYCGGWHGYSLSIFESKRESAAQIPIDATTTHRRGDRLLKINVKTPTETNIKELLNQNTLS